MRVQLVARALDLEPVIGQMARPLGRHEIEDLHHLVKLRQHVQIAGLRDEQHPRLGDVAARLEPDKGRLVFSEGHHIDRDLHLDAGGCVADQSQVHAFQRRIIGGDQRGAFLLCQDAGHGLALGLLPGLHGEPGILCKIAVIVTVEQASPMQGTLQFHPLRHGQRVLCRPRLFKLRILGVVDRGVEGGECVCLLRSFGHNRRTRCRPDGGCRFGLHDRGGRRYGPPDGPDLILEILAVLDETVGGDRPGSKQAGQFGLGPRRVERADEDAIEPVRQIEGRDIVQTGREFTGTVLRAAGRLARLDLHPKTILGGGWHHHPDKKKDCDKCPYHSKTR